MGIQIQQLENYVNSYENEKEFEKIKEIQNIINSKDLIQNYLLKQIPFVLRGGASNWLQKNKSYLSPDNLLEKMGESKVHIKASGNGQYEGSEDIQLWSDETFQEPPSYVLDNLVDKNKVLVRPLGLDVKLKEIFQTLLKNNQKEEYQKKQEEFKQQKQKQQFEEKQNKKISNSDTKSDEQIAGNGQNNLRNLTYFDEKIQATKKIINSSFYIEYLDIQTYLPQISKQVLHDLIPNLRKFLKNEKKNFWLGAGDTTSNFHFDAMENYMVVLQGSKTFNLIGVSQSGEMKEGHLREAVWKMESVYGEKDIYELKRKQFLQSTSMVNTPLTEFSELKSVQVTLYEGDVLYLPAWVWHEVSSTKSEETGLSMAINFWFDPIFKKQFPCPNCQREFDNILYEDLLTL